MPEQHDVTHTDIYVRLAELGGKIDLLGQIMTERSQTVTRVENDVNNLFNRMRSMESRMAQVTLAAAIAVVLIPVISSWLQPRLSVPVTVEQQENVR